MGGEWAKVHLKGKKKLRAAVDTELKENIEIGIETEIEGEGAPEVVREKEE